jgi:hypothetical protein
MEVSSSVYATVSQTRSDSRQARFKQERDRHGATVEPFAFLPLDRPPKSR